jgi:nucleotide-binding universal stress UspA family protein
MQISKILLPVDGSTYSDHATEHAIYLARLSNAHITAVSCYEWLGHMVDIPDSVVEELKQNLKNQAADVLEKTAQILDKAGINHTVKTISGSPGTMLTNLAKSKEFDLIVMGSHGHSDIAGLFLGSVTHKVLNTIYCPVLVVP